MNIIKRLSLILFCVLLVSAAQAAEQCSGSAEGSKEYVKATRLVEQLPEFIRWSKSHRFPVAFGEPMDEKVTNNGRCYWSVSVYADHGSRLELWNAFLVPVAKGEMLVEDMSEGEYISLKMWRQKNR